MTKVLMTIIVNCKVHLSVCGRLIEETGQDSNLRFYCLYCNLLTDHVIAIQKGKDSTAEHKEKTPPPCSLSPLPLLFLSGCWPRPIPCPSIVRHCNIVLCFSYIYILASWWFMRCTFELFQKTGKSLVELMLHTFPFVRESQDSPGSNLPVQDRFRKKV